MGLKEIRINRGQTQEELGRALALTKQTISNMEKGMFSRESLEAVADYYKVSTDFILGRDESAK